MLVIRQTANCFFCRMFIAFQISLPKHVKIHEWFVTRIDDALNPDNMMILVYSALLPRPSLLC